MELIPKRNEPFYFEKGPHIEHLGIDDPNHIIYNYYIEKKEFELANKFLEYRKKWESTRQDGILFDHPLQVSFGIENKCNLLCAHCYRRFNNSKFNYNRIETMEVIRILNECKKIGVNSIVFGIESEFYMNKDANKILQHCSDLKFEDVWVTTNGHLLSTNTIEFLCSLNITRLCVSMDAITEKTYSRVRGHGYYRTMSNIFNFLDIRKKLPILRVSFIKYSLNKNEVDRFVKFWKHIADEVDVQTLLDVKNINTLKYKCLKKAKCYYPFNMLYINWNGDYKPCCSEFCKHLTLGNIREISILEAWNTKMIKKIREQFSGKHRINKYCSNCLQSFHCMDNYDSL